MWYNDIKEFHSSFKKPAYKKETVALSRIGFDKKKHPFQLQLRICLFPDWEGSRNRSSVIIDLQNGKITNYQTDKDQINTTIKEYVASNKELKELYSF